MILTSPPEKSNKSRPWKHVESLKRLSTHLEDNPEDWASLKAHYDSTLSLVSEGDSSWTGWEDELASSEVSLLCLTIFATADSFVA